MLMVFYPLAALRWIHFLSVFVLFGSSFFWFYMGSERFRLARADCLEPVALRPFCCASPRRWR